MDELLQKLTNVRKDLIKRYCYLDPHLDEAIQALAEGRAHACGDILHLRLVVYDDWNWDEVFLQLHNVWCALTPTSPQAA